MGTRLLSKPCKATGNGVQQIQMQLPAGSRLKRAEGGNGNRGFEHISIYLVSTQFNSAGTVTTDLPADRCTLKYGQQGGINTGIGWSGDLVIDPEYRTLLFRIYGCVTGDEIDMFALVEENGNG